MRRHAAGEEQIDQRLTDGTIHARTLLRWPEMSSRGCGAPGGGCRADLGTVRILRLPLLHSRQIRRRKIKLLSIARLRAVGTIVVLDLRAKVGLVRVFLPQAIEIEFDQCNFWSHENEQLAARLCLCRVSKYSANNRNPAQERNAVRVASCLVLD